QSANQKPRHPIAHVALYATGPQIQSVILTLLVADQEFSVLNAHARDEYPLIILLKQRDLPDMVNFRLPELAMGWKLKCLNMTHVIQVERSAIFHSLPNDRGNGAGSLAFSKGRRRPQQSHSS